MTYTYTQNTEFLSRKPSTLLWASRMVDIDSSVFRMVISNSSISTFNAGIHWVHCFNILEFKNFIHKKGFPTVYLKID